MNSRLRINHWFGIGGLLILFGAGSAGATNVASYANGNWTNPAVWRVDGVTNVRAPDVGDDVLITNTVTMSESAQKTVGSLAITNGGVLTHTANVSTEVYRVDLVISNTLAIVGNGKIDVNARGYAGVASGNGYGPGGGIRQTIQWWDGGAGGFGGQGGQGYGVAGGGPYGSIANPTNLGSAGGGGWGGDIGGAGGGAVKITAGALVVNGLITANGTYGSSSYGSGGSGSGGSVWINTGIISGNGTISANGGSGLTYGWTDYAAGGGGGRIAIYCGTNAFVGTNMAAGGYGGALRGGYSGGAGTYYLKIGSNAPSLFIDSSVNTAMTGSAGTWVTNNSELAGFASLTIRRYGILKHVAASSNGLSINIPSLIIESNAAINVTGLGYPGVASGAGTGPGGALCAPQWNCGGGAGFGGTGGKGGYGSGTDGGPIYATNTITAPTNMGSAGGSAGNAEAGGAGGGVIRLVVEALTLNGTITADGASGGGGNGASGGGSGGSVWINAYSISGAGTIRASGGAGGRFSTTDYYGGGGGGGRVAVYVVQAPFYGGIRYQANGGTSGAGGLFGSAGNPGTLYLNFKTRGTVLSAW
jgi:hypothetical protein